MVFPNVRQRMKKRSAMFWKTMGNVSPDFVTHKIRIL